MGWELPTGKLTADGEDGGGGALLLPGFISVICGIMHISQMRMWYFRQQRNGKMSILIWTDINRD